MTTPQMFNYANRLDLQVYDLPLSHKKALSFEQSTIIYDSKKIESDREFREIFSEEIGHCVTGSFYPLESCNIAIERLNADKMERRAKDYSFCLQVPIFALKQAIKENRSDYEIAEALDVEIRILREAVTYYKTKGLL